MVNFTNSGHRGPANQGRGEGENKRKRRQMKERPREFDKQARDVGPMLILIEGVSALLLGLCPNFL